MNIWPHDCPPLAQNIHPMFFGALRWTGVEFASTVLQLTKTKKKWECNHLEIQFPISLTDTLLNIRKMFWICSNCVSSHRTVDMLSMLYRVVLGADRVNYWLILTQQHRLFFFGKRFDYRRGPFVGHPGLASRIAVAPHTPQSGWTTDKLQQVQFLELNPNVKMTWVTKNFYTHSFPSSSSFLVFLSKR